MYSKTLNSKFWGEKQQSKTVEERKDKYVFIRIGKYMYNLPKKY